MPGLRSLGAMGRTAGLTGPNWHADLSIAITTVSSSGILWRSGHRILESGRRRNLNLTHLCALGIAMDGNRNPDPSLEGEMQAIQSAIGASGCPGADRLR